MTTAVTKITAFWNVKPCSLVDRQKRFEETYSHHVLCQMDVSGLSEILVSVYSITCHDVPKNNNFILVRFCRNAGNNLIDQCKPGNTHIKNEGNRFFRNVGNYLHDVVVLKTLQHTILIVFADQLKYLPTSILWVHIYRNLHEQISCITVTAPLTMCIAK
jgi:hypothetical protein